MPSPGNPRRLAARILAIITTGIAALLAGISFYSLSGLMGCGGGYLFVSALIALGGLLLVTLAITLAVDWRVIRWLLPTLLLMGLAARIALLLMPVVHCPYPG